MRPDRTIAESAHAIPAGRRLHCGVRLCLFFVAVLVLGAGLVTSRAATLFERGVAAYKAGHYEIAAQLFDESSRQRPSAGAFLNLGNAEWRRGQTGRAILAWEQALWVDPFLGAAKSNLQFARRASQLDAPYLAWYEVASSWLPNNWWAWLAGLGLWTAIGAAMLPGILRLRRLAWHQAVSALGLGLFLLSLPAHLGVVSRSHCGFVLERETPLRLTPTRDGQVNTKLAAGEAVRIEKQRGEFLLVRTQRARGWIETRAFGALVPSQVQ